MAVLHDYFCARHGIFEATEAKCPRKRCKAETIKVFLKSASLKSERTKKTDRTARQLAADFKMTDLKPAREGENQAGYYTRNNATPPPLEPRPGSGVLWGESGKMNMKAALAGGLARPTPYGEQVGLKPADMGAIQGPRVASYTPDHENLKLKPIK